MTLLGIRTGASSWVSLAAITIAVALVPACAQSTDDDAMDDAEAGTAHTDDVTTKTSSDGRDADQATDVVSDASTEVAADGAASIATDGALSEEDTNSTTADASANDSIDANVDPTLDGGQGTFEAGLQSDSGDASEGNADDGDASSSESPDSATAVCPADESYFHPGCGVERNPLEEGCYQTCEGASDTSCKAGTVCTIADVDPCVCDTSTPGVSCCAACGAEIWLCQAPGRRDETCPERSERAPSQCR